MEEEKKMRGCGLYADGGVINKNPSALGGTWAWCQIDEYNRMTVSDSGILTPKEVGLVAVTNNVTELFALVSGITHLRENWQGHIFTDSYITIRRVFHRGAMNGVPDWLARETEDAYQKLKHMKLLNKGVLLDGHPTEEQLRTGKGKRGNLVSEWNRHCDRECNRRGSLFGKEV